MFLYAFLDKSRAYYHMGYTSPTTSLRTLYSNMPRALQAAMGQGSGLPQRHFIQKPQDDGSYILPLKQSFIKDARLMPGTRCMLALLVGWSGKGRGLALTQARIAKHLGRSVRQIYRYLKDAVDNGYLTYNYTKTRIGLITGIHIYLRFDVLKPKPKKQSRRVINQARTSMADTNTNINNTYQYDEVLEEKLNRLRQAMEDNPK